MNSMLDTALSYARNGYHVFPCQARGKKPATPNGFKDATRDEEIIRKWWSREPEYNIGIPTGKINRIWALDVDGSDGVKSANKFQHEIPKDVPMVRTPNGYHLYFKYDQRAEKLCNSVKSIPGLDVRANGGYVLAVGSVLDAGEYRYRSNHTDPVEAPQSLVSALVEASKRVPAAPVEATIPEGKRDTSLFSLARSLYRKGLNENEVYTTLATVNENRCKPPLDDSQLIKITTSGAKYERGELRIVEQVSSSSSLGTSDDSDTPTVRMLSDMRRPRGPRPYIIDGLLFKGFPAAIYGDGGTAKSTLVMHMAQCVARGVDWLNFDTVQTNVLYLDFELDEEEQSRRAYEIASGMGYEKLPEGSYYISAAGYRTRDVFKVALQVCREKSIGMVIVDSAGYALEGDAESSSDVLRFFREYEAAFRREGVTMLMVDHQAKGGNYQDRTMFGSVYKGNSARSVFQVEPSERGDGYMNLTIRHKKVNFGAMLQPFGVSVRFVEDTNGVVEEVRLSSREMDAAELAEEKTVNAADRVVNALEDGPRFPAAISIVTGLDLRTVKNTLTKLRKAHMVEDTGIKDANGSHEVALQVSSSSIFLSDDDSDTHQDRELVAVN